MRIEEIRKEKKNIDIKENKECKPKKNKFEVEKNFERARNSSGKKQRNPESRKRCDTCGRALCLWLRGYPHQIFKREFF